MAILTTFTGIVLIARRPGMGSILVRLTESHGIHSGDLPVFGLWILGLLCCALLWRDARS